MKRLTFVCFLLFVVLIPVASNDSQAPGNQDNFDSVVLEGELVRLSGSSLSSLKKAFNTHDFSNLSFDKRLRLYEEVELSITRPVLQNLFLGSGTGSKQQGDVAAYLFGEFSDWATLTVTGVGVGFLLIDLFFVHLFDAQTERGLFSSSDPLSQLSLYTMIIGGGTFLLGRVIQAVLPISYGLRYNKTLRNGLDINKDLTDRLSMGMSLHRTKRQNTQVRIAGVVGL